MTPLVEARHPWGFRYSAGVRQAIGDAKIPDLSFGGGNQPSPSGRVHAAAARALVNPEHAEFQRSELADPRAEVQIAQTRQDLFLAAATQFWDWVTAVKFVEVQRRAMGVAEDRFKQVEGRAKAGAVAPLDVVEANQEVQRRREVAIAAQRLVEQEQLKLSMFLWEDNAPVNPSAGSCSGLPVPDAMSDTRNRPSRTKSKPRPTVPEIKEIDIEARINNIDLSWQKIISCPAWTRKRRRRGRRKNSCLGLGYRFGLELKIPILQRKSRGEVLEAQGKADRFVLTQKFREQQVVDRRG